MRRGLILVVVLFAAINVTAQWTQYDRNEDSEEKLTFQQKMFIGSGLGLGFTAFTDYFSISPLIGYRFTRQLVGGIQFQYRYTNYKSVTPHVFTSDYGVSPFLRYLIYPPFFLHTEIEYLNYQFVTGSNEKYRKNFNSFLGGGGLFQPLGQRVGIYTTALYNFSYVRSYNYSPYGNPWIFRVGFTLRF
jgi:hypothetical protein